MANHKRLHTLLTRIKDSPEYEKQLKRISVLFFFTVFAAVSCGAGSEADAGLAAECW